MKGRIIEKFITRQREGLKKVILKHFWSSIQSVGNLSVDAADSRGWRTVHHAALHGQIKV